MKSKIKTPKSKLQYKPEEKVEYKTTSFRLPIHLLKNLEDWVDETVDDNNSGSVNDLVRQIIEWAVAHKGS